MATVVQVIAYLNTLDSGALGSRQVSERQHRVLKVFDICHSHISVFLQVL